MIPTGSSILNVLVPLANSHSFHPYYNRQKKQSKLFYYIQSRFNNGWLSFCAVLLLGTPKANWDYGEKAVSERASSSKKSTTTYLGTSSSWCVIGSDHKARNHGVWWFKWWALLATPHSRQTANRIPFINTRRRGGITRWNYFLADKDWWLCADSWSLIVSVNLSGLVPLSSQRPKPNSALTTPATSG